MRYSISLIESEISCLTNLLKWNREYLIKKEKYLELNEKTMSEYLKPNLKRTIETRKIKIEMQELWIKDLNTAYDQLILIGK